MPPKQDAGQRMLSALGSGLWVAARECGRVVRQLWLQIAGTLFLMFAVVGAAAFIREYRVYAAGEIGLARVAGAACFTIVFGWFAITSFWRARSG